MTRVVAQGTFDLLHPGHVHYLEDAATHGDELHVIVARQTNVTHKPDPILCARQRRDMVDALGAVDEAHLGDSEDVFVPIERLDPDVIVLGFDQHHDEADIAGALADRGIDCRVERATSREPRYDGEVLSSGDIVDRILRRRTADGDGAATGERP
ncbi:adenylyltransferase/cytidyltransferase family protein [Halorubrum sp. BV1]|uniref:adenylyltransferase/cytidyltransferase family protein n=1 Tax=Halorubrum sp. BV1 TaxID=1498500 RepID=UPI000678F7A1|nr:adenylyltransferase/cytidyltransferase family protein [Halorubrum sp. BV1]